jgi:hypothetical protein
VIPFPKSIGSDRLEWAGCDPLDRAAVGPEILAGDPAGVLSAEHRHHVAGPGETAVARHIAARHIVSWGLTAAGCLQER